MALELDIIETVDKLFNDIYKDFITIKEKIDTCDNNNEFYNKLMKTRVAVLCLIALNPINTCDTLYVLTPKDYLLK